MAGMHGPNSKKREPWQYVVLLVMFLILWFVPQVYELRGEDLSTVRVAVMPIKVWQHLIPDYSCVILPGQLYTTGQPMLDMQLHPDSRWWNVVAAGCRGSAQVRPSR